MLVVYFDVDAELHHCSRENGGVTILFEVADPANRVDVAVLGDVPLDAEALHIFDAYFQPAMTGVSVEGVSFLNLSVHNLCSNH